MINEQCDPGSCTVVGGSVVGITVTGNNPQPSSFSFTGTGGSQLVTLGPGNFRIGVNTPFQADFSGSCAEFSPRIATGTINEGQQLTCTITIAT